MAGDLCLMAPSIADRLFHTKSTAVVLRSGDLTPHPVSCQVIFCECASKTAEWKPTFVCLHIPCFMFEPAAGSKFNLESNWQRGNFSVHLQHANFASPPLFLFIHLSFSLKNNIVLIQIHKQVCCQYFVLWTNFIFLRLMFSSFKSISSNSSFHFHHSKSVLNPNSFYTCMDNVSNIFGILVT